MLYPEEEEPIDQEERERRQSLKEEDKMESQREEQ